MTDQNQIGQNSQWVSKAERAAVKSPFNQTKGRDPRVKARDPQLDGVFGATILESRERSLNVSAFNPSDIDKTQGRG